MHTFHPERLLLVCLMGLTGSGIAGVLYLLIEMNRDELVSRISKTTPGKFSLIDEIRPVNGTYLSSNPPAQVLGCSVHWFEEHSTFRDGGLVAHCCHAAFQ